MRNLISETLRNRELIWALALKELRVRYKRSTLGFLWALLNPLLTMVILTVVFSSIMRIQIDHYPRFSAQRAVALDTLLAIACLRRGIHSGEWRAA